MTCLEVWGKTKFSHPLYLAENFLASPILTWDPKEMVDYKYANVTYSIGGLAKTLMYGSYIAERARSQNTSMQAAMEEDIKKYPFTTREAFKVDAIRL